MLYGYGGFSVSMLPAYRRTSGVARTRRHLGDRQHARRRRVRRGVAQGGMLEKKQNVFDDFIAVAEQLIKDGYTSPIGSASWAAPTGDCSSEPSWSSGPISLRSRCPPSA